LSDRDQDFLQVAIQVIERIREKSLEHGHGMLASLLDMAKAEAEDALRTYAKPPQQVPEPKPTNPEDELEAEFRREIIGLRRD
jgi:hypothetical protein